MSQYVKALLDIQQNPSGSTVTVSNHPTSIEVSNHPTTVEVSNHPTSIEVSNHPTSIEVSNFPVGSSSVEVSNFPASQVVSGSVSVSNHPTTTEVSNFPASQVVSGSVSVSNHPTTTEVSNFPASQVVSGSVSVSNHPTTTEVSNFPTSTEVSNFPASQVVSGSVSVSNHPTTTEVSNFPASQVVSGSVSVSNQISGFSTETTLSSLDGKISTGSGLVPFGTHIQQVLIYGLDTAGAKHPLDVDDNGNLKIIQQDKEIQRATTTITTDFGGGDLLNSLNDGKETMYWDSQNYDKFQAVISNTNGAFMSLRVQASTTTDNADFVDIDEAFELGVGDDHLFRWTANDAFQRYYRFKNSTGSPITFDSIQVHFLK
jgi:hypothetical protein